MSKAATRIYEDSDYQRHELTAYERSAQRIDAGQTSFPRKEYYRRVWKDERGELFVIIEREVWSVSPAPWLCGYIAHIPVGFTI